MIELLKTFIGLTWDFSIEVARLNGQHRRVILYHMDDPGLLALDPAEREEAGRLQKKKAHEACADKLKWEMETYGCPPKFPSEDVQEEIVAENVEVKLPGKS
ncbi:unnamed protein product [Larinioides sclopetarius]|uniref:Uncharacterized protein n=1 Tax=Larinioides sclopetarius TaxID=280406 RepID=A0AAV2BI03_9ARAC